MKLAALPTGCLFLGLSPATPKASVCPSHHLRKYLVHLQNPLCIVYTECGLHRVRSSRAWSSLSHPTGPTTDKCRVHTRPSRGCGQEQSQLCLLTTLWTPNVWGFFSHRLSVLQLWCQLGVLQFNSILTLLRLNTDPKGPGLGPTRRPPLQTPGVSSGLPPFF